MRTSKIRDLIRLVEESGVDELEVSFWGKRVRIRKRISGNGNSADNNPQVAETVPDKITKAVSDHKAESGAESPPAKRENLLEIKSPMVGTFYHSPAPDAKPYVEVGEKVARGQTVCIIEAMKIMNEIESEYDGRVVEMPVQNAQPVQFGQPLIMIEPI